MRGRSVRTIPLKFLGIMILGALALVPGLGRSAQGGSMFVEQSSEEALNQDIALMAEARGWTMERARARYMERVVVGETAQKLAEARPDVFIGSALSNVTDGGLPEIYVKGPADQAVRDMVASAPVRIRLVDGQPFSSEELRQRQERVLQSLLAIGFMNMAVGSHFDGAGQILVTITKQPGLPTDASQILSNLPDDLSSSVTLKLVDTPIGEFYSSKVGPTPGERSYSADHLCCAFGGMRMRYSGDPGNALLYATSGWTVKDLSTGVLGISTAGHSEPDIVDDPGSGYSFGTQKQAEHRGLWGDMEWHVVSAATKQPKFYATATEIRNVTDYTRYGSISVGMQTCSYGRSSNVRDCSLTVQVIGWSCVINGVQTSQLVGMNGNAATVIGDSGGGWSLSTIADGAIVGECDIDGDGDKEDVWTPVDRFDEGMNVQVLLSP